MIKIKNIFWYICIIALAAVCHTGTLSGKDKKPYTFEDAMKFKLIRQATISADGKWLGYCLVPDRGDANIYFRAVRDTANYTFPRGSAPKISKNSEWAAFQVLPKAIDIDNAKTPKDKPKNTFSILNLKNGKTVNRSTVQKYIFSNDGQWLGYQDAEDKSVEKDKKLKDKQIGSTLNLRHLSSGTDIKIDAVGEFVFDSLSNYVFYTISTVNGEGDGLFCRKLKEPFAPEMSIKTADKSHFANLEWSETADALAFQYATLGETGKPKDYSLFAWYAKNENSTELFADSTNVPKNNYIPQKNTLKWSKDGKRLFFSLKPNSERYDDNAEKSKYSDSTYFNLDTIAEKADLYLWHWNDPLIMTNQRNRWSKDKDRNYLAIYNTDTKKVTALGDSSISTVDVCNNSEFTVAMTDFPYLKEKTWYGDIFDIYSINLQTGERTLIERKVEESPNLSPDGKRMVFYKDKNWYSFDNLTKTTTKLTNGLNVEFHDVDFDMPMSVPSYGFAGWVENGSKALIYDKYDIWMFNLEDRTSRNLTGNAGRLSNVSFRIRSLEKDKEFFTMSDTLLLQGFDNKMKVQSIFLLSMNDGTINTLLFGNKKYYLISKAEFAPTYIYTKESYEEFPDLWTANNFTLTNQTKLTDANPEIKDYEWGSTEIVRWVNSRGDSLDGYIIKPENFNPKKRYPVYVYFYERFSDRTYNFNAPMINHRPIPQVFNSGGYVMFLPDIKYHTGTPGPDALDAIMTGSKKLIDKGIADPDKFCIQGHSWSAYQTAYIVTQTDFFKAACAGAPVANMTSAYGQIRLESGLTRQFQYEAQQSRIGGTLWDSLENYLLNSPLFHVNKTNTPLLIMSGDIDEAVPWHQSVELYMAYRRLSKNIVFLQYQDEPHWPGRYQNKLDYATKMKEFFDYYVLGKTAKDWILNGKPYKGK